MPRPTSGAKSRSNMDLKQVIKIEIEKKGHVFSFEMPVGVPLGLAYDCAFEVLQAVIEMSKQAAERARPKENEENRQVY